MKFIVEYPVATDRHGGAWLRPETIARFARTAEAAGLDALSFTDHPAPSAKWLRAGGHESLDPFAALGFCAAVTSRIRMMTRLTVLPYRNPFVSAKSMATVDVLSGGRATFVLGVGYLRSEFAALGVDFSERNALFDEAVEVLQGVWTSDDFRYSGRHFAAVGQLCRPLPVQRPHPPLWLGGNASIVLDRVVRFGSGWSPLLGGPALAAATRTREIGGRAQLSQLLDELGNRMVAAGRQLADLDIAAADPGSDLRTASSIQQRLDDLGLLGELGVSHAVLHLPTGDVDSTLELIEAFGRNVIEELRAAQPAS